MKDVDGTGMALGVAALLAGLSLWGQYGDQSDGSFARSGAQKVAEAWAAGERAKGGAMSTDGETLYSYDLVIGRSDPPSRGAPAGHKVLYNYTASGQFKTATTSQHVSAAKPYADEIVSP